MRAAFAVFLLLLVTPAVARAESAALVTREVPLRAERTLSSAVAPRPFELVGLQWRGSGAVRFRTRSVSGGWSAWRGAVPESEDRPDLGSRERSVPGWRLGNPFWVGPSDRLEVRTRGRVTRVRAHYVRSPAASAPPRTLQLAQIPELVRRPAWGANETRRDPVEYAPNLRFAVVHHTAGSNSYSRAEAPAIVRGIQTYHVRGNGWNDIGYNFLVDKYGQVYEGRFGGITRNVVGAHAEGFNDGTVGIAVLGSYTSGRISAAAQQAIARLIAWRLDIAHVDPLGLPTYISNGNARYPRGTPVVMRGVVGHRETGFTSCPGDALMGQLAAIARGAWNAGLPKVLDPRVQGSLGARVRFTARLSAELPWTVTVADSARHHRAQGDAGLVHSERRRAGRQDLDLVHARRLCDGRGSALRRRRDAARHALRPAAGRGQEALRVQRRERAGRRLPTRARGHRLARAVRTRPGQPAHQPDALALRAHADGVLAERRRRCRPDHLPLRARHAGTRGAPHASEPGLGRDGVRGLARIRLARAPLGRP
jgi:hypothetical protein